MVPESLYTSTYPIQALSSVASATMITSPTRKVSLAADGCGASLWCWCASSAAVVLVGTGHGIVAACTEVRSFPFMITMASLTYNMVLNI